jgi:hypothetical protein
MGKEERRKQRPELRLLPRPLGDTPETGAAGGGKDRLEQLGKQVIQFLAAEGIYADNSMRLHPNQAGIAQYLEMPGGSGFTEIQRDLATVQTIGLGDSPDNFQPGRIAQSEENARETDLIFGRMEQLSHPDT